MPPFALNNKYYFVMCKIQLQESNDVLNQFHVLFVLTLDYKRREAMWIQSWPTCQWLRHTVHHAWKCFWESVKGVNSSHIHNQSAWWQSCPDSELNFYFHFSDTLISLPTIFFLTCKYFITPRQIQLLKETTVPQLFCDESWIIIFEKWQKGVKICTKQANHKLS